MEEFWLCEPKYLKKYLEERAAFDPSKLQAGFFEDAVAAANKSLLSISGTVAHIAISGILSNEPANIFDILFGHQTTQYSKIREAVQEALADEDIKSIVLDIHSPGGAVDGVDETFQALVKAGTEKPITAVNHGLIASAAYWLAMSAKKITATSAVAVTGSIGVVVAGYVFSEERIKKVVLLSKNAPKKFASLEDERGRGIIQEQIDAVERVFISRVAEGRGVDEKIVISDFGNGGVFIALDPDGEKPDALSVGMIDEVISADKVAAGSSQSSALAEDKNETKEKGTKMTIAEFLKLHPELAGELEKLKAEASAAGVASYKIEVKDRAKLMVKIIDSEYPKSIKDLAVKVITGESHVESVNAAVGAYDAVTEKTASEKAAEETEAAGETPGAAVPAKSEDGVLRTAEDEAEATAQLKN